MNKQWSPELHDFPAELLTLLDMVRSGRGHLAAVNSAAQSLDWQAFASLALHHRLYPTIHAVCNAQSQQLPSGMLQWLNQKYQRNAFTMLQLSGQMQRVTQALTERHIRALQLKGPVLAQLLYGDLSRRTSKDLDVLVPMEQADEAEQILLDLGFVKTQEVPRTTDNWRWRYNHESYVDERTGVEIELHWRLNGDAGAEQGFEELWERRQQLEFGGTAIQMLGQEDLLIYLCVHGARHAWFRLRWLVDIDRLVQRPLDWNLLRRLTQQYKCSHIVGQAFVLTHWLLRTPISGEMAHWADAPRAQDLARRVLVFIREKVNLCPEPETQALAQHYRSYQYALKTSGQKALFWLRKMAPDDWDMQTLPLPKMLYFMYYPLHPFLLLYRRTQRRDAVQREVEQQ